MDGYVDIIHKYFNEENDYDVLYWNDPVLLAELEDKIRSLML